MAATAEGNKKTRRTRLKNLGACEQVCEQCDRCRAALEAHRYHMRKIASRGGRAPKK